MQEQPAPAPDLGRSPWARPWRRHCRYGPPASRWAAIASKLAPTQPMRMLMLGSRRWRISIVGAALAATGPPRSAGFGTGCCYRGQKAPPTASARAGDQPARLPRATPARRRIPPTDRFVAGLPRDSASLP